MNENRQKKRYPLTRAMIDRAITEIKNVTGCDVVDVFSDERGYLFVGKHKVVLGNIDYNPESGTYSKIFLSRNPMDEIRKREEAIRTQNDMQSQRQYHRPAQHVQQPQRTQQRTQQRSQQPKTPNTMQRSQKRKFKLQKNKRLGITFTASAIAVLVGIGAITHVIVEKNKPVDLTPVPGYSLEQRNTVADANDIVLYSWANYAKLYAEDIVANSNDDNLRQELDDIVMNYYDPMLVSYDDYIDQVESGLTNEAMTRLKQKYQISFRNYCYLLDEALEDSPFAMATFDASPYADAFVYDAGGEKAVENGMYGEMYNHNGELLIPVLPGETSNYYVFVKAVDVPNHDYTIENLPRDTIFVDGEAYVADTHLDDFQLEQGRSK